MLQVFEPLAGLLSELDVLLSFADLASSCPTPYTRPEITPAVHIYHLFPFFSILALIYISCFRRSTPLRCDYFHDIVGCGRYCIRRK